MQDYPLKRRRLMVELNVHCPVDLAQAVIPTMIERGEGWIINLSSATSNHPQGPPYDLSGVKGVYGYYGASKAMLDRVTTAMASELHGTGHPPQHRRTRRRGDVRRRRQNRGPLLD